MPVRCPPEAAEPGEVEVLVLLLPPGELGEDGELGEAGVLELEGELGLEGDDSTPGSGTFFRIGKMATRGAGAGAGPERRPSGAPEICITSCYHNSNLECPMFFWGLSPDNCDHDHTVWLVRTTPEFPDGGTL